MNRRAYLLGVVAIFAANLAAVALRAFAEAGFLGAYSARDLPIYLVSQAIAFAIGTSAYDAATARAAAPRVDRLLTFGLVVAAAAAAPLVDRGRPWPFVVALGVVALSSVVNLALWNLVAASVAGRDARRALPRAGAAVTLGGAIAGLGAAVLIREAGAPPVAYVAAAAAAAAAALAIAARRELDRGGAPGATAPPGSSATATTADHRALITWLAIAAILEAAVATVLEFRFGAAMKARYSGDDLFAAISLFYGATHLVLLLLQVTVVPRLLTSSRLPVTVSIHPIITGLGAGLLAAVSGFAAIAVVRTSDFVLRAATSRTGQELSLSALPPVPRARWKVLLRGAATSLGVAAAGVTLVAFGPPPTITIERIALALVIIIVLWLTAVGRAAQRFLAALAAPLGMKAIALARRWRGVLDLDLLTRMVEATGDPDPTVAGAARAALARTGGAADEITPHLAHDEPAVRRALYGLAARRPNAAARRDLATAAAIEEDPRALAAAVRALAAHGAIEEIAAIVGRDVENAAVLAAVGGARAQGSQDPLVREAAAAALVEHDGAWAAELVGARRERYDAAVTAALAAGGEKRRQALVAATAGGEASVAALLAALTAGDREAALAVATLEDAGARNLLAELPVLDGEQRAAIARARAAGERPGKLLATLAEDDDDDVRSAALRSLAGHARAGEAPPAEVCARLVDREREAVVILTAARSRPGEAPALHAAELDRALRAALDRLLLAVAIASAAAGREPAPLLAAGRRLVTAPEAARKRALDVVQELAAVRLEVLDTIERALRPSLGPDGRARSLLDPWLAELLAGAHATREPALAALRACRFFESLPGRHADDLASRAGRKFLAAGDVLIQAGARGDAMYVVISGTLAIDGVRDPLGPGRIVGEMALVDDAPRAATVRATGLTEVLVIDRTTFEHALRRWPDLGVALCRGLAEIVANGPTAGGAGRVGA